MEATCPAVVRIPRPTDQVLAPAGGVGVHQGENQSRPRQGETPADTYAAVMVGKSQRSIKSTSRAAAPLTSIAAAAKNKPGSIGSARPRMRRWWVTRYSRYAVHPSDR
jgi:hypothetical protein